MVIVLFFDISFLAQFISISTLVGYILIMSIVVYKKMARKRICLIMQFALFMLSLIFGVLHQMGFPDLVIIVVFSIIVTLVIVMIIE